jgi:hypothetical protein
MRSKLAALSALVTAFAIFEFLFYPRSTLLYARSTLPRDAKALAARLLPTTIGSFRSTERWTSNCRGQTLEVYTSYRDGRTVEADVDIWLGARVPHNGIGCWYVRGDPMFWQRLSNVTNIKYQFEVVNARRPTLLVGTSGDLLPRLKRTNMRRIYLVKWARCRMPKLARRSRDEIN